MKTVMLFAAALALSAVPALAQSSATARPTPGSINERIKREEFPRQTAEPLARRNIAPTTAPTTRSINRRIKRQEFPQRTAKPQARRNMAPTSPPTARSISKRIQRQEFPRVQPR